VTRRVEIVVDELVVRGLAPGHARIAAAQLEARLTELAGSGVAIPERSEHARRLPNVVAGVDRVGEAVAGAVWHAISGKAAR
jgi:hypothetical protein